MAKKRSKVQGADIDWYLISIDRLKQIGLVVLLILLGAGGYFFWQHAQGNPRSNAESAINEVKSLVRWGAGPRAGQALVLASKARALLAGRFAVTLDDLRAVAPPVLRHRILVNYRAEADGVSPDAVTARLLATVPAPASPLR